MEDESSLEFLQVSTLHATVIAQQFEQDILGDLRVAFDQFVESGQVWALLIGLILGYLIRGVTSY
ncbi:MAG: hypothetical protein F6K19_38030 [Cyanothece sp. SIO1E1]|nr:hypothetical protein [Cyanothece sp. SIO1E1]